MPRRGNPGRLTAAAAATAIGLATASCGTTVNIGPPPSVSSEAQSLGAPPSRGLSPPLPAPSHYLRETPSALEPTLIASPGSTGGRRAASPDEGAGTVSPASVPSQGPSSGNGFDAKHIYIGIGVSDDATSFAQSLGLNANVGDVRSEAQAVINQINRHGGLAGRQIVPVWFNASTVSYNVNPVGTVQSECAAWTQDHHVFAAVNVIGYPNNGVACLAQSHAIAVTSTAAGPVETADLDRFSPYYYAPGTADSAHLVGPLIAELKHENYFEGWNPTTSRPASKPVRIGVLYAADRPDLLLLTKKALARYGLKVSQSFYLASSAAVTQLAGAVLRFKAEGVTHVLTYGFLSVFPEVAATQGYFPRYGVSSWDGLRTATSSEAERDFVGAMGVGWTPFEDGNASVHSVAERGCLAVMHGAGLETTDRTTNAVMTSICDQFSLLRDALTGITSPSPAIVDQRLDALGGSFESAATFGERFAPGRHAGVAAFRPLAFNAQCKCFAYTGATVRFP